MEPEPNPLLEEGFDAWERLVATLGPPGMLLGIERRMGTALRQAMTPEDLWQETLLHLWRDRRGIEWRGWPALRRLVLQIAENRIRNAADLGNAQKRGGGAVPRSLDEDLPPPVASTTPSRIASHAEAARAMGRALDELPDELREVVRLRLLEEVPVLEVAERLGLGESAVKHRLRRGAQLFHARVRELLTAVR